jgi:sec-independent protein translocase protein TatA
MKWSGSGDSRRILVASPFTPDTPTPHDSAVQKENSMSLLAFFGMPGHIELLIVAAIILLLFGHRLPSVMRSLGRGVVEFKRGVQGIEEELDDAVRDDADSKGKSESGSEVAGT